MTLTTPPLPDASFRPNGQSRLDVRPILTRSADNAWERTEQLRTDLHLALERLCRAHNIEALVLQSDRYVHPAWVKFESWLPTGQPGVTARSAMTVTITTEPYRRFEAIYKVEWHRYGHKGVIHSLYRFGATEAERLLKYLVEPPVGAFAARTVRRILGPVQLRQSWTQFWKPTNKVVAVRRDWIKVGSLAAVIIGAFFLIPRFGEQPSAPPSFDPTSLGQIGAGPTPAELVPSTGGAPPSASSSDVTPQFGTLDDSDPRLDNGTIYEAQAVTLGAGESVVVTMRSNDFDTLVTLGEMRDSSFVVLVSNDDAPDDGTNSRLEFVAPTAGEYLVLFSAYEPGHTGAYTFTIQ